MPAPRKEISLKKVTKLAVLLLLKVSGIFALMRYATGRGVRILAYHGVWLGDEGFSGDCMFMNPATFKSRLKYLRKWRFPVVPLDQAVNGLSSGKLPLCPVVITIDDGWYSTYKVMLPALIDHCMPATLYCDTANVLTRRPIPHVMANYFKILAKAGFAKCTDQPASALDGVKTRKESDVEEPLDRVRRLAQATGIDFDLYDTRKVFHYMRPEELVDANKKGLDIQLHTHNHSLQDLSADAIANEIRENRRHLSQLLNVEEDRFQHFCYPSGIYTTNSDLSLNRLGILSSTITDRGIAYPGMPRQFLPRIMDGEQLAPLELEAELSGVMDMLRRTRKFLASDWLWRTR